MNNKRKFLRYLEESQYVSAERVESTDKDNTVIGVAFTQEAGYEITQFVCEKANEYNFRVFGVYWEGGIVFINESNSIADKLGL